jgi:multicomponent Na+:H+ antiporter subunit G
MVSCENPVLFLALISLGSIFLLLAAVGSIKFPDFFTRMAAISKASTLGAAFFLLAPAVANPSWLAFGYSLFALAFLFLSAPVASHLLGRAGYKEGVPLFVNTQVDQWNARSAKSRPTDKTPPRKKKSV